MEIRTRKQFNERKKIFFTRKTQKENGTIDFALSVTFIVNVLLIDNIFGQSEPKIDVCYVSLKSGIRCSMILIGEIELGDLNSNRFSMTL